VIRPAAGESGGAGTIAVLDANVLYSAALRDLWMRLALEGAYVPRWTEQIHDEWTRNVLLNRPDLTLEQLRRTRQLMDRHAEGSLVQGYEHLIPVLSLPDPDDRHVLAAAIAAEASVIVTFNGRDFPPAALEPHGIAAVDPDDFALSLLQSAPAAFVAAVRAQLAALVNPPRTWTEHQETLRRVGLPRTADALRQHPLWRAATSE
jgi:predicted nucleic acid-binding protein